jgi:hypothetical protein
MNWYSVSLFFEHCEHERGKCFQLALGHGIDEYLAGQEPYELQVKISWRGVVNRRGPNAWGCPNMWWRLGRSQCMGTSQYVVAS